MFEMLFSILGASFLGCYGAIKFYQWEENRASRKARLAEERRQEAEDLDEFFEYGLKD